MGTGIPEIPSRHYLTRTRLRVAGEQADTAMVRWLEGLPKAIRERLAKIGLLDHQSLSASKPLALRAADYEAALLAKGNTRSYLACRRSTYPIRPPRCYGRT